VTETATAVSRRRRQVVNIALGAFFFVLGVIGILIPVMPQIVFFFLSAFFFSRASQRLRRALRRFRQRYPKLDNGYKRWREKRRRKRRERIRRRAASSRQ
jgi:uncharacterized membrane protein YbaN (DUF454 family)